MRVSARQRWHQIRAYFRDTLLLLRQFRLSLLAFFALTLWGALWLWLFYRPKRLDFAEALYATLMLIFLNPTLEFPPSALVRPVFFVVPIVGVGIFTEAVIFGNRFSRPQVEPAGAHRLAPFQRCLSGSGGKISGCAGSGVHFRHRSTRVGGGCRPSFRRPRLLCRRAPFSCRRNHCGRRKPMDGTDGRRFGATSPLYRFAPSVGWQGRLSSHPDRTYQSGRHFGHCR